MTDHDPAYSRRDWHLDRNFSVGLILAIAAQAGALFFWGGALTARVDQLEQNQVEAVQVVERLARIEAKQDSDANRSKRIENRLDDLLAMKSRNSSDDN